MSISSKRVRQADPSFTTPERNTSAPASSSAPAPVKRIKFESKADRRKREQQEAKDKDTKERKESILRVSALMSLPPLTSEQQVVVELYLMEMHEFLMNVGEDPDFHISEDELCLLALYRAKKSGYNPYGEDEDEVEVEDEDEDEADEDEDEDDAYLLRMKTA